MKTLDNIFIRAYSRDDEASSAAVQPSLEHAKELSGAFRPTLSSTAASWAAGVSTADVAAQRSPHWSDVTELVVSPTMVDAAAASGMGGAQLVLASVPTPGPMHPSASKSSADSQDAIVPETMRHRESDSVEERPSDTRTIRPVRLDTVQSGVRGPHFRAGTRSTEGTVAEVRVIGESTRGGPKLQPLLRESKFAPAWEVDEFGWSPLAQRLATDAQEPFQAAGTYLRGACREGLHALAITSASRGAGRTVTALGIARAVAASGVRAAILDADCERPAVASQLGLQSYSGWEDVILEGLPLEEVAVYSLADRFAALPLSAAKGGRLQLHDPRVTSFIHELGDMFDLVIIDMGPLGGLERRMFEAGNHCPIDAAIIVRDLRATSEDGEYAIGARLRAAGVKSVGIVENFARAA